MQPNYTQPQGPEPEQPSQVPQPLPVVNPMPQQAQTAFATPSVNPSSQNSDDEQKIKHRNLWKMFFLYILLSNAYALYWFTKTGNDLNRITGSKMKNFALIYLLYPFITLILLTALYTLTNNSLHTMSKNVPTTGFAVTFGVLLIVWIVFMTQWFVAASKAINLYTKNQISAFAAGLCMVSGIGILYIQNKFNQQ